MDLEKQKKQFGIQAEDYTKFRKPYPQEVYEKLFSLLPVGSTKILDIACGTGKSTEPLVREGVEVFGCDHDPLMIEEAQKQAALKNLPITYSVAEAEHLPFEDSTFDAVTVGTAFHWFVNEAAIKEIHRILKPKGSIFIFWTMTKNDPRLNDDILAEVFQKYNWQRVPSELRDQNYVSGFLHAHGFENIGEFAVSVSYEETIEERIGLEKTNSGYGSLTEENKKNFLIDLQKVLEAKLGGKKSFSIEEEIQICYGLKK